MTFPELPSRGKCVPFWASNWDALSGMAFWGKLRPVLGLQTGTPFPLGAPGGKRIPFRGIVPRYSRRLQSPPISVCPDKTCQNKPVPIWQVLEADGEGDLMVVAGYSSGAAVGLGDGAHDG